VKQTTVSIARSHRFAEINARRKCKNAKRVLQIGLDTGEYLVKCRCARCSLDCYANFAAKRSACLYQRLVEVENDTDYAIYGGSFTLNPRATPEDHVRVKRLYRQEMMRWAKRTGYVFGLAGQLHITRVDEGHWDHHCYTDCPEKPFRRQMRDCWQQAGGRRNALRRLKGEDDIRRSVRYGSKDIEIPKDEDRYIPAPRRVCPLDHVWEIGGFWAGRKVDVRWSEILDERYPDRVVKRAAKLASTLESGQLPIDRRSISLLDSTSPSQATPETIVSQPESRDKLFLEDLIDRDDLTPFQKQVKAKYLALRPDLKADAHVVLESLPYDPEKGLGVSDLSERLTLPRDHVQAILETLREAGKAVLLDGRLVDGKYRFNRWHRNEWRDFNEYRSDLQQRTCR
jgi:hypothetical protein